MGYWEGTRKARASDLQALRVSSQQSGWVYYASKAIESAVYCFYKTIISW